MKKKNPDVFSGQFWLLRLIDWFVNLHCTAHRISSQSFLHKVYAKLPTELKYSIWKYITLAKGLKLEENLP